MLCKTNHYRPVLRSKRFADDKILRPQIIATTKTHKYVRCFIAAAMPPHTSVSPGVLKVASHIPRHMGDGVVMVRRLGGVLDVVLVVSHRVSDLK